MTFPKPVPAQVIRYSYLWHKDAALGAEEGNKDRPCAIVMMVQNEDGEDVVTVLPITHAPPYGEAESILYGSLSGAFFEKVRLAFLAKIRAARANIVTRTE